MATILLLGFLLVACGGDGDEVRPIPAKTVVLTFDDATENQLAGVVPILEESGFRATFFVTHRFREWIGKGYLEWDGIEEFHRRGFEVGNHTLGHLGFNYPQCIPQLATDISMFEEELARRGIPKPVSFGWPGDAFSPDAVTIVDRAGYRFGRRGRSPEAKLEDTSLPGPLYDPLVHHPLLIPATITAGPGWTLDRVRAEAEKATEGKAVVFQFHGVPDPINPEVSIPLAEFRSWMEWLKSDGFRGIALRDLDPYIDRRALPDDPMTHTVFPDLEKYPFPEDGGSQMPR